MLEQIVYFSTLNWWRLENAYTKTLKWEFELTNYYESNPKEKHANNWGLDQMQVQGEFYGIRHLSNVVFIAKGDLKEFDHSNVKIYNQ